MDLREITEFFKDTFKYIIVIVIAIVVFLYVVSFQQIVGNSMSPVLKDGDVAVLSKIGVKIGKIKRNQIVALKTNDGKLYVKRIIGLPGEEIHYLNGILYIDGIGYKENYLEEDVVTRNFMFEDICNKANCPEGIIPNDMYLVLGDNRGDSLDSRDPSLGLIKKDNIVGKSLFKIWPISEIGKT